MIYIPQAIPFAMQFNSLTIAGSREWSLIRHLNYEKVHGYFLFELLSQCKAQNVKVFVGDHNRGIDAQTISTAMQLGGKITVMGITYRPRNLNAIHLDYWISTFADEYVGLGAQYAARDREMISLTEAYIGIWNGKSKGTLNGFEHALEQGRKALLLGNVDGKLGIVKSSDNWSLK